MKYFLFAIPMLVAFHSFAKKDLSATIASIVAEGKLLYKTEMASWHGTDLFLEHYKEKENIGGYFSYLENEKAICIFFSKAAMPKVIGAVSFDSTYNLDMANIDLSVRDFTTKEKDLYDQEKNLERNEVRYLVHFLQKHQLQHRPFNR